MLRVGKLYQIKHGRENRSNDKDFHEEMSFTRWLSSLILSMVS